MNPEEREEYEKKVNQRYKNKFRAERTNFLEHFIMKPIFCNSINYVVGAMKEYGISPLTHPDNILLHKICLEEIDKTRCSENNKNTFHNMIQICCTMMERDDTYRNLAVRIMTRWNDERQSNGEVY